MYVRVLGSYRRRMRSPLIVTAALAGGLAMAACSAGSEASPSPTSAHSSPLTAHPERGSAGTTAPAAPTTAESTSVPPTTSPATTAPPITAPPSPEVLAACDTLAAGEYTARVAAASAAPREQIAAACPDTLDWTEQAMATAAAAQAAHAVHGTWVHDYVAADCQPSGATLTVTNPHPVAVAMWGATWGVTDDPLDLAHPQPVHIARIEPGASATTTLTTEENGWAGGCWGAYQFYVVPGGDPAPDAGLPAVPATGPQSDDDPGVFYPVLDRAWRDAERSLDQVALFGYEDVHSLGVPHVLADWMANGSSTVDRPNRLQVCGVVLDGGPGIVMVSMRHDWASVTVNGVDQGPRSVLQLGMFRESSDGNWRWLGTNFTIHYDPPGSSC